MKDYRDHAANERVFLGWVQCGIGFLILGFLVERFDLAVRGMLDSQTLELGATPWIDAGVAGVILMLIGSGLIVCAGARYYGIRRMLRSAREDAQPRPASPTLMAAMVLAPLFAALVYFIFKLNEYALTISFGSP